MLLLVLILVLVAFALLVVALVQGSVLWAWLSVAISIAAASALLFDWWQRQQAQRAEEAPQPPLRPDRPLRPPVASADIDSVTEFIPVVPQPGYGPARDVDRASASGPSGRADLPQDAETRFIPSGPSTPAAPAAPPSGVEQTVLLPVARPPGSMEQPPGATPPSSPWTGDQSRSVTNFAPQPVGPEAPAGWPGDAPGGGAGEATVLQHGPAERPQWTNGAAPAGGSPAGSAPADAPGVEADGESEVQDSPAGDRDPADDDVPGDVPAAADDDATAMVAPPSTEHLPPPVLPADPERGSGAGPALPPAGPDGEPPEEPHVPAAAAVVAALDDEVVVVDERPRYHVVGCPFLPGRPVIPLPVHEAVEYGFSPCGWCAPNRVLALRSHTAARQ